MHIDPLVVLAGLAVGCLVGTTGMGGGALMTPILVLLFGVQPLAAISSDLVSAAIMKPVGGAVHLRRGTVDAGLVRWLAAGSVPAAFAGVLIIKAAGGANGLQQGLTVLLGVALLVATGAIVVKGLLPQLLSSRRTDTAGEGDAAPAPARAALRPLPTLAIGVIGGLMVGMTSVGSGSLMIVLLLVLYPGLALSVLVGTDLVQAIPLVASAALAHLIFGDVKLGLTASLIIGSVPGVCLGARFSSRAPDHLIRPVLAVVLLLTGLKLVGVATVTLGWVLAMILVLAGLAYGRRWVRRPSRSEEGGDEALSGRRSRQQFSLRPPPQPSSPVAEERSLRDAVPTPGPPAR